MPKGGFFDMVEHPSILDDHSDASPQLRTNDRDKHEGNYPDSQDEDSEEMQEYPMTSHGGKSASNPRLNIESRDSPPAS